MTGHPQIEVFEQSNYIFLTSRALRLCSTSYKFSRCRFNLCSESMALCCPWSHLSSRLIYAKRDRFNQSKVRDPTDLISVHVDWLAVSSNGRWLLGFPAQFWSQLLPARKHNSAWIPSKQPSHQLSNAPSSSRRWRSKNSSSMASRATPSEPPSTNGTQPSMPSPYSPGRGIANGNRDWMGQGNQISWMRYVLCWGSRIWVLCELRTCRIWYINGGRLGLRRRVLRLCLIIRIRGNHPSDSRNMLKSASLDRYATRIPCSSRIWRELCSLV